MRVGHLRRRDGAVMVPAGSDDVSASLGNGVLSEARTCDFGDVRVDFSRMTVTRAGTVVDVEPKVFDVLRFLIAHRDRLVTKEELLDGVWRDTFVAPNALTRAIAQLRKALGDDADAPRYIETASRRGYRFIAPVVINGGGTRAEGVPVPTSATRSHGSRRVAVAALAVAAVLVSGLLVWVVRRTAAHGNPTRALTPSRVTTSGGINVEPALSPDGSAIAFASDRSGSFEIYIVGLARGSKEIAITSDGKNNVQPAWSPDGRWIAYAHSNGGGIWVVPSTGGAPQQLVESGSNPVWSPDSNWLAFTTQAGLVGQSSLRVVGRNAGGLRDLTSLGSPVGGHRSPAWSHNGRFVAFATVRGADEGSVWIVEAAGGTPRRLLTQVGAGNLQFSSDDRALFFTGIGNVLYRLAVDPADGVAAGEPQVVLSLPGEFDGLSIRDGLLAYGLATNDTNLWTIELGPDGAARPPVRFTDEAAGRTTRPDYSPDGRRLTYLQGGSGGQDIAPWVMNADGTGKSPLITEGGGAGNTSWAPDGTRVMVQRDTPAGRGMFWLDLATRRLTPLDLVKNARNPRLSPDGREIAYWMIEANGATNTWTQSIDGGEPRRITADAESISYPAWSPDGEWLAVQIKRGRDTHVGVVSKHGGPVEQLTTAPGLSGPNSWSPDGEEIAYVGLRDGVWNVWSVSRRTHVSRQLTHFSEPGGYVLYPSWSPDGHHITFERGIRRGTVWTVQVE